MSFQKDTATNYLTQVDLFKVTLEKTPSDKLQWKPDPNSMSAQEMVEHLTGSQYFFAALIKGEDPPAPPPSDSTPKVKTREQLLKDFQQSCDMMAKTIGSAPDKSLDTPIKLPFGHTVKTRFIMTVPGFHATYHWGQLSYVQKMWGDNKDHMTDPSFPLGGRY
ncbi:DinB family protein [Candidatus Acetothermia bacterium]|nr:DinB family protein [Candidatus Acetothermia bacterium]MBI3644125.1 DinB family protein [Candidatus Acetothermia bacterium]